MMDVHLGHLAHCCAGMRHDAADAHAVAVHRQHGDAAITPQNPPRSEPRRNTAAMLRPMRRTQASPADLPKVSP